jgi:UDP-N-acetylmuramoyl-L-alanyl-D-glutamate--2,6-diaminopimelate ligase
MNVWPLSGLLEGMAVNTSGNVPGNSGNIIQEKAPENVHVTSITLDSRKVTSGTLFVAVKGLVTHGLAYAEAAEKQGAAAIIWETDESITTLPDVKIPLIEITDLHANLGVIADRFYGSPSQKLCVIGITGTDGKTTVSHFIAQALNGMGKKCGVIGTLGIGIPGELQEATHTTPDVLSVHRILHEQQQQGITHVAMEVSSHALDQGRVNNVKFDVAVLTNLTRDHLDYHGTVEAYAAAKRKLFFWPDLKGVVLNLDDQFGQSLAKELLVNPPRVQGYAIGKLDDYPDDTIVAIDADFSHEGMQVKVATEKGNNSFKTHVLGAFNLSNSLAALGAMVMAGINCDDAVAALEHVNTVPGRMERVQGGPAEILVVVDYAHTPGALEQLLLAVRKHTKNRIICLFGCGGDRDKGKRPLMGQVAEIYADKIIVTDDNPRTEDPKQIVINILKGFGHPDTDDIQVEHDRAKAIRMAIEMAEPGDAVVIAGKGHETEQIFTDHTVHFDDREQASKVLRELSG